MTNVPIQSTDRKRERVRTALDAFVGEQDSRYLYARHLEGLDAVREMSSRHIGQALADMHRGVDDEGWSITKRSNSRGALWRVERDDGGDGR